MEARRGVLVSCRSQLGARSRPSRPLLRSAAHRRTPLYRKERVHSDGLVRVAHDFVFTIDEPRVDHEGRGLTLGGEVLTHRG